MIGASCHDRTTPAAAGKGVPLMLVLARKERERIVIGDNVVVTVLEISGSKVRLGIEAPADVPVQRGEVWVDLEGPADQTDPAAS
jgi:carbon storage regulator CsrA